MAARGARPAAGQVAHDWIPGCDHADDLESIRRGLQRLQSEAARVQREIVDYASLSQAALQSTKTIAESLTQWKKVPDAPTPSE